MKMLPWSTLLLAGITAFIATLSDGWAAHASLTYNYDAAGRLTRVNYGGTINTAYTYDPNGNLLSRINSTEPLPLVVGEYFGLITNATPGIANEGVLSLQLSASGAFTGKLTIGGKTYSFRGTFAEDGSTAPIVIQRKGGLPSLTLMLAVDVSDPALQITGTLTDGTFTSQVALDRALFGKSNPAPANLIGKYTAFFRATSNAAGIPQGTGFARVSVNPSGSVRATGVLADGSKFSQGTPLTGDGTWPFFAALYKKKGLLAGFIEFGLAPNDGEFTGTLDWVRPAGGRGPFASGFNTELDFSAAHYVAPPRGQRALDLPNTSPNARFNAPGITRPVTLTAENKIIVAEPNPEKLTLKLKVKSGLLKGRITVDGKARKLSGILQLEQNEGAGFFLTDDESLPFNFGN